MGPKEVGPSAGSSALVVQTVLVFVFATVVVAVLALGDPGTRKSESEQAPVALTPEQERMRDVARQAVIRFLNAQFSKPGYRTAASDSVRVSEVRFHVEPRMFSVRGRAQWVDERGWNSSGDFIVSQADGVVSDTRLRRDGDAEFESLTDGKRSGGSGTNGASEDWRYRQDARAAVRARLKSPSTASFSGERFSRQSGEMVVVGMVESQNGFGAMVRSGFRVTFSGTQVTGVEILER